MAKLSASLNQARLVGLLSAACALGLGLLYLAMAGAPVRYLVINLAAFVLGAAIWLVLTPRMTSRWNGRAMLALGTLLLATALFGPEVAGVSRWVPIGPLSLQVSFLVVPAIVVLYGRLADAAGTAAILLAALALAIQPDRAMAAVLAAGVGAVALTRYSGLSALAFVGSTTGFGVTMFRHDVVPPQLFVERVLFTAFDVHIAAGFAVVIGCCVLLMPTVIGIWRGSERTVLFAFGASWAAAIASAAIGNYPTPLVGYGASPVLGYLLSVALLGRSDPSAAETGAAQRGVFV